MSTTHLSSKKKRDWLKEANVSKALRNAEGNTVLVFAGIALGGAWLAFILKFGVNLLPEHFGTGKDVLSHWGQLGDFMGGVLNPILSFLALIAVSMTLRLTALQLEQTRASQEAANTASQITALHSAATVLTEMINQMLAVSGAGGPVHSETYNKAVKQRQELTDRMLELSKTLL